MNDGGSQLDETLASRVGCSASVAQQALGPRQLDASQHVRYTGFRRSSYFPRHRLSDESHQGHRHSKIDVRYAYRDLFAQFLRKLVRVTDDDAFPNGHVSCWVKFDLSKLEFISNKNAQVLSVYIPRYRGGQLPSIRFFVRGPLHRHRSDLS